MVNTHTQLYAKNIFSERSIGNIKRGCFGRLFILYSLWHLNIKLYFIKYNKSSLNLINKNMLKKQKTS